MNIDEMGDWRFLTKEDCEPPVILKNAGIIERDCSINGDEPDMQFCLTFEHHKGIVPLRKTVRKVIAELLQSKETDDWIGKILEWYVDSNVEVRGVKKGGIRPRLPGADFEVKPQEPASLPLEEELSF